MTTKSNYEFEIVSVRPPKTEANYLALVTFAYRPGNFYPVKIGRSVEKEDGWHNYLDAEVKGAEIVHVHSSFLRRSRKGELKIQINGIDLPRDLSRAVAEAAYQQLELAQG